MACTVTYKCRHPEVAGAEWLDCIAGDHGTETPHRFPYEVDRPDGPAFEYTDAELAARDAGVRPHGLSVLSELMGDFLNIR